MKKLEITIIEDDNNNLSINLKAENISVAEVIGFLEMTKNDVLLKSNKKVKKHDKNKLFSK